MFVDFTWFFCSYSLSTLVIFYRGESTKATSKPFSRERDTQTRNQINSSKQPKQAKTSQHTKNHAQERTTSTIALNKYKSKKGQPHNRNNNNHKSAPKKQLRSGPVPRFLAAVGVSAGHCWRDCSQSVLRKLCPALPSRDARETPCPTNLGISSG